MHANAMGITVSLKLNYDQAVTGNGKILNDMRALRKDNTGYDLKHLFIGSEGTLGIITECAMLCPVIPKYRTVCWLAASSFD